MKSKILSYLQITLKILTLVGALSAYEGLIPPKYTAISLMFFGVVSTLKDSVIHLQKDFTSTEPPPDE